MKDPHEVTDGVWVMPQPTTADLRRLAADGIRTVVNLRHAGEFDDPAAGPRPLSIEAEGDLCLRLGMDYAHLPVSMKTADARLAEGFEKVLAAAREQGPVAVHCRLGQRAGAMVLIAAAKHLGWDGPQAIAQAERLGLADAVEPEKLNAYVRTCLPADS